MPLHNFDGQHELQKAQALAYTLWHPVLLLSFDAHAVLAFHGEDEEHGEKPIPSPAQNATRRQAECAWATRAS